MSADNAGAITAGNAAMPAKEIPRSKTNGAPPDLVAAKVMRAAKVSVPRVELKTPEKPELSLDVAEKRQNLEEAIQRLNDQMRRNSRDLAFAIDRRVDRTVITVRSAQTGEVVRQIPDEAVLRVAHSIEDIKGMLLNETA